MTTITKEIEGAYMLYLAEPVDTFVDGRPILRSDTWPYNNNAAHSLGIIEFAAGWERALKAVLPASPPADAVAMFREAIVWDWECHDIDVYGDVINAKAREFAQRLAGGQA